MRESEIKFQIQLDEQNVPEKILWDATDKPEDGLEQTNAILLALWDQKQQNTLRIDLWSKEMTVTEMKKFYVDAIGGMAESLRSATGDDVMADDISEVCRKLVKHIQKNG